jgi:hypothetical protein
MPWELTGNAIASGRFLGTTNDQPLVIRANNMEAMRIDPSGNVGIGTTTPSAKLNIDPRGPGGIVVGDPNTGGGGFTSLLVDISNARDGFGRIQAIKSSGSAWGDIYLNPLGGNVGIGTTNPFHMLQIGGGYDGNLGFDGSDGTPNAGYIRFGDNTGWKLYFTRQREQGGGAPLNTGTTGALMTIQDNGNVGIGTTAPGSPLHVAGDARIDGVGWIDDANFKNDVTIGGNLTLFDGWVIAKLKLFTIDHPLDPANKYLRHASVESPDLKTFYDGIAELDVAGEAVVELPEWFETLNKDFRYQLTGIGGFAPVYIAEEITNNRFKIAGGKPGMEVCWQVTGVRHDAVARATPVAVEEDKPDDEKGYYQNPEAHGQPKEMGIRWKRDTERRRQATARKAP